MPALPAVALHTADITVVVDDRSCRPMGDALVAELGALPGLTVRPGAPVVLYLLECRTWVRPSTLDGGAHALVSVGDRLGGQSHLIGSARHSQVGEANHHGVVRMGRSAQRALVGAVARDLADQIRPLPRLVQRRLYSRAPAGSPRALHNLAVAAEQRGDLPEALRLATAAHASAPSDRARAYLHALQRQLPSP